MVDNRGVTPLMLACQAKCSQCVYLLLKYNAKINLTDNINNSTALVWAMLEHPDVHMLNVIKMLINNGADVNIKDRSKNTSLLLFCKKINEVNNSIQVPSFMTESIDHSVEIVDLFLNIMDDVNAANDMDETPLIIASKGDRVDIIQKLIAAGADVIRNGCTAFLTACRYGSIECVQKLSTYYNEDNMDFNGRSVLFHACIAPHVDRQGEYNTSVCSSQCTALVRFIIEKYGDVNRADGNGVTPLMLACQNKCSNAVGILLENKADIQAQDKIDGSTALIWAMRRKSDNFMTKVVEMLMFDQVNTEKRNSMGFTPLMLACEKGYNKVVQLLNDRVQTEGGKNKPLRVACKKSIAFLFGTTTCANDYNIPNESLSKFSVEEMITIVADLVKYKRKVTQPEANKASGSNMVKTDNDESDENEINGNNKSDNEITRVMNAFQIGNISILRLLIEGTFDINESNSKQITPLMKACEFGESYIDIIKMIIDKNVDFNKRDIEGRTALFRTCDQTNPSFEIVNSLFTKAQFEKMPDITIGNNFDRTPLMALCSRGRNKTADHVDNIIKIIELLINHLPAPESINQRDTKGKTSLMYACEFGHYKIVEKLLYESADINARDVDGRTALYVTCSKRNPSYEIVQSLFETQPSNSILHTKIGDNVGKTPLMLLCSSETDGNVNTVIKIIDILLNHLPAPECINQRDTKGKTSLMYACEYGQNQIVEKLLNRNADINAHDKEGRTALFVTCNQINPSYEIVQSLCKAQPSDKIQVVTIGDNVGKTPLMLLCSNRSNENVNSFIEIIDLLLNHFPAPDCINQRDTEGKTSLMYACEYGNHRIVEALLNGNTDINARDKEGRTALLITCNHRNPSYEIIQSLFSLPSKSNLDITIGDNFGYTPLMLLCKSESDGNVNDIIRIIDLIFEHSSPTLDSINLENKREETCLMIACQYGHYRIVSKLLEKGVSINKQCVMIAETRNNVNINRLIKA